MAEIIFIHGMWSHKEVAFPMQEFFEARGHRFHTPELPCHQRDAADSPRKAGCVSIRKYARHVENYILNERFDEPPILIGHSMGGLIAQIVAARIETGPLVLLNSAAPAGINHIFLSSALTTLNVIFTPFFWRRRFRLSKRLGRFGVFNRVDPEIAAAIQETLLPESGRTYLEIVFSWLDPEKSTAVRADSIISPVLVVTGYDDRIIPSLVARKIYARYPQADFHGFAGLGHWIFFEDESERVYHAVSDWLEALRESTETSPETEGSIQETHHGRPHLHPATKTVSAAKRAGDVTVSLDPRIVRRSSHADAEADRGTILPR